MMTYMDIVLQNSERLGLSSEVKPGGLLYFHIHDERLKFEKWGDLTEEALNKKNINQAILKEYKLKGLINSDAEVIDAMDIRLNEISKSDIVPVTLKKMEVLVHGEAKLLMKQRFINLFNTIKIILLRLLQILWMVIQK